MNNLNEESRRLLESRNPSEILSEDNSFEPIFRHHLMNESESISEPTQSSSPIRVLGKRQAPQSPNSLERGVKQMRIHPNYESKYINYGGYGFVNPHYVPKYLHRINLPINIIETVYNTFLTKFDRDVIMGETILLSHMDNIYRNMHMNYQYATANSWNISYFNIFEVDNDSPHFSSE
ncbi:hypothetical protein [Circoviridae sp.]|nr:hypothetical protein [Circoviridae sp.]